MVYSSRDKIDGLQPTTPVSENHYIRIIVKECKLKLINIKYGKIINYE